MTKNTKVDRHILFEQSSYQLLNEISKEYKVSKSKIIDKLIQMFIAREVNTFSTSQGAIDELNRIYVELVRQGTNINQIAYKLNINKTVGNDEILDALKTQDMQLKTLKASLKNFLNHIKKIEEFDAK